MIPSVIHQLDRHCWSVDYFIHTLLTSRDGIWIHIRCRLGMKHVNLVDLDPIQDLRTRCYSTNGRGHTRMDCRGTEDSILVFPRMPLEYIVEQATPQMDVRAAALSSTIAL